MSENKKIIETYLGNKDRSQVAGLLDDDVVWIEWVDGVPPTGAVTRGKEAFIKNFGTDELETEVIRLTEENNVVVAEGKVRVVRKDGPPLSVRFVDVFELENGKVKRLNSFGATIKEPA
jgi:uncharacterized protein